MLLAAWKSENCRQKIWELPPERCKIASRNSIRRPSDRSISGENLLKFDYGFWGICFHPGFTNAISEVRIPHPGVSWHGSMSEFSLISGMEYLPSRGQNKKESLVWSIFHQVIKKASEREKLFLVWSILHLEIRTWRDYWYGVSSIQWSKTTEKRRSGAISVWSIFHPEIKNVHKHRGITGMEYLSSSDQDRPRIGGVISGM